MTEREQAAFAAGVKHAADMALVTAMTIEVRPDARQVRQRVAIEALRGLADGLKASLSSAPTETTDPIRSGLSAEPRTTPSREARSPESKGPHETPTLATEPPKTAIPASLADLRHAAVAAGYSGDPCPSCQNFTLKRSGTCLVCETCGSTTGCS